MLKAISISTFLVFLPLTQYAYAEVVDESWRQVYEFQSKMAARGNNEAQFTLGEMYEHGRGVKQNYDTAIDWYTKAKANGHTEASKRIAMIHQVIQQAAEDKNKIASQREIEQKLARQKEIEQKRAAEARRKQKVLEEKRAKKAVPKKKAKQVKLTPEERARKIKEAQERAKLIAQQNLLKQQQEARAALERYKKSIGSTRSNGNNRQPNNPDKYIDPFE